MNKMSKESVSQVVLIFVALCAGFWNLRYSNTSAITFFLLGIYTFFILLFPQNKIIFRWVFIVLIIINVLLFFIFPNIWHINNR